MASKLTERDKNLLDASNFQIIGNKPYEDGKWGSKGDRDFVHFQIFDSSNNLIQYDNLPLSDFIINSSNDNVEFYPGSHIRKLGFESGVFTIRYNFLRKLAGNESAVLVHTLDKNDTKIGDVYTNTDNIYITEDGVIYAGTEEQYRGNPTTTEQLKIEDLKYQIHEISPSRTEVRLRAKQINSSYISDFVNIQTPYTIQDTNTEINFLGNSNESITLTITPNDNGFIFSQQMVGGSISIPDVYEVDEIAVAVRSDVNVILNPSGEEIETDNLGNVLEIAGEHEWDATLHDDAIRVSSWSDGFLQFSSGDFFGTSAIGYHAKWVQREGIANGNCIKFSDTNDVFRDLAEWPASIYRKLSMRQEIANLQGQGVKVGDFVNVRMDVKSSVPDKGVQIALSYPNELVNEDKPQNPPDGYFDVNNVGPTEPQPTSPPAGYVSNTEGNAFAIEDKPPMTEASIRTKYRGAGPRGQSNVPTPFDAVIGTSTTIWGGEGAWKVTDIRNDGVSGNKYFWGPNLAGQTQNGTLSIEGDWIWTADPENPPFSAGAWVVNPTIANSLTPPNGTSGKLEAINFHPATLLNDGDAFYSRIRNRGENKGWQTAVNVGTNETTLLFKEDLIWEQKYGRGDTEKLEFYTFDNYFSGTRNVTLDEGTANQRTVYDDIFRFGFIQSVDRVSEGNDEGIKGGWFVIFYNNGDRDSNGNLTENSNRYFFYSRDDNAIKERQSQLLHFTKNIDGPMNQAILDNEGKLETHFKVKDGNLRYHFHIGEVHYDLIDGDNGGDFEDNGVDGPKQISDNFPGSEGANAIVGDNQGYGRVRYIIGDRVIEAKGDSKDGVDTDTAINDNFYRCGEVDGSGDDLTYGVRNPSAANYGIFNDDGELETSGTTPIYDNGLADLPFPDNPTQIGALSLQQAWKWNGSEWLDNSLTPPRYSYITPEFTTTVVSPANSNEWETLEASIEIPFGWQLDQKWFLYLNGDGQSTGNLTQGVVWVDNVFMDFTFTEQSETIPVSRPYVAQINSVSSDGLVIEVNKSFKQKALEVGVDDQDESTTDIYDVENPSTFENFSISYLNFNPKDLRTYLKFDNNLFLTVNFKQDLINVTEYPNSVVFKLYEPLPSDFQEFDECVVVKEMTDPLEESINIIDFIPEEEPRLVLKSPDLKNAESPIQKRDTQYKTEDEILTSDASVASELKNEFISQSLNSVEINTDYSQFENFVNFSSAEKRIRNFKLKLENIESYKISSASYVGVSGSANDLKVYHSKILETKNNLDDFEKYMYFKSSSYVTSSLGEFFDNAWPKTGGDGTPLNSYVLAHTTSSQASTWFTNTINSASVYDTESNDKLSNLLPEHIKFDTNNQTYLTFTDMIGQHFDHIWEYINALSHTYDRRDKLDEGLSKDLIYSIANSLGWNLNDGKDLIDLPKFALGKQVTGSAVSNYSNISERDISREIWGRIVNNMPFFLKNKGTVRALKGLINIYGIPSTILRVKEYGGPNVPDNKTPQFEITRKFTKALDFRGGQSVKTAWANDGSSARKPDTIEFRFRAATGSNQILVEKQDGNNQDFFIRLKDNGSSDNYGCVSFIMSGSKVGIDQGEYKEITSSALPVYDGDFYSVMVARTSGSDNVNISQSYQLNVGKYDASRSKIHLYSTSTMDISQVASSSFSNAWTGSGDIYIGGSNSSATVGAQFSGSIMEYRQWTETLNTSSFKNHIANPKAYNGNTVSSSYENLVLRYSFDDNKSLASDTEGIRDVSSNQTTTLSGSHAGFTGNFFRSVVDEQKTHIPSIGALRRSTNKVRIEDNPIKNGQTLNPSKRATKSVYDSAPNDSNKVGIWFAPTDVINNDIINSVGDLNFENFLGDPRDKTELSYRGLNYVADNYWKKYTAPNSFWDYIRLIKYYDQSLYPQLRKMIPARAKPDIGLLIEPNIFERPKVVVGKKPIVENKFYSASIDVTKEVMVITGSYNHGSSITNYDAYTGKINIYSYETGSSVVSSSGTNLLKEASGSEARDSFIDRSIWQRLGEGKYSNVTMSFGDTLDGVKGGQQDIISGSRIYRVNQKTNNFYTSAANALIENANSSSLENTDLDNFSHLFQGLRNSFYEGVKNNNKTTIDGKPVIEVIISAPTKLVTTEEGNSTLKTGDGIIPDFKESVDNDEIVLTQTFEEGRIKKKKKKRGLKGENKRVETDQDRKKVIRIKNIEKEIKSGKLIMENDPFGKTIDKVEFMGNLETHEELEN